MDNNEKQIISKKGNDLYFFDEKRWAGWNTMAETFIKSGALPASDNTATVMMKIQAGFEMGMKPLEAVKSFYFVKGVMNIFGSAVTRRITDHGWTIKYIDELNKCTATIKKGDQEYTDTLTFDEAVKSKWTHANGILKAGWYEGANRKMKLRYGVLSMLIKTYVPDVLGSAVDIKEVAEDTVPMIQGEEVSDFELDGKSVDIINASKDLVELKKICRGIADEKGKEYQPEVLKYYTLKKTELEAKSENN